MKKGARFVMKKTLLIIFVSLFLSLTACSVSSEDSYSETPSEATSTESSYTESATAPSNTVSDMDPILCPAKFCRQKADTPTKTAIL